MDATEKIHRYETYDALLDEIRQDMVDNNPLRCRYPVRFVMFNNFEVFKRFARDLSSLGVNPLNLEDLLPKDQPDGWITTDDLSRAIKACSTNTLVTPFSELVRFYKDDDFRGFFNEIMLIEDIDHPSKRIYIPLIGLQNRFSSFLNSFARIEESAPVWAYLIEEHKTEVFLTKIKNPANSFSAGKHIISLNSVYEWLRFWKDQAPQTQIICSSSPIYRRNKYSDPDNIFTFKYIENAYEYITSFLEIDVPIAYDQKQEPFWVQLLQDIMSTGPAVFGFTSFICSRFNFFNFKPKDIFFTWSQSETSAYDRWLISNYFLSSQLAEDYPYLKLCFEELKDFNVVQELPTKVAERIFYFSEPTMQMNYASEREELLLKSPLNFIREHISSVTQDYIKSCLTEISQNNIRLAIELNTGVFDFEKVLLAAWYADQEKTGLDFETLSHKYKDLALYLTDQTTTVHREDNWHMDYLREYRQAKLLDEYTDGIKKVIAEKNHDSDSFYGWYHSFEETHNRLAKDLSSHIYNPDKIYWIDALGYEFLPYILSLIKNFGSNYKVVYSEVTRCTIPSATLQNRFDCDKKYGSLDEVAHDNSGYKKYITLITELHVIQGIVSDILTQNSYGQNTIAIVSDHGLSCLSRKVESLKYDDKVEHDGRYIKIPIEGKIYHDTDYVVHTNENDGLRYKVALTHASLGRRPVHEVHGGCTPEEVLVPYIIITNKPQGLVQYSYELITNEIQLSNPEITVNIMPQPSAVMLTIADRTFKMNRSGNKWTARIDSLAEGNYTVNFDIPKGTSFQATVKVIGTGIGTNDFLEF